MQFLILYCFRVGKSRVRSVLRFIASHYSQELLSFNTFIVKTAHSRSVSTALVFFISLQTSE